MKKEEEKFKGIRDNCKKEKSHIRSSGKTRGLCKEGYRKLIWKPNLRECKRCGRMKKHQAHNLCPGCYNFVFHLTKDREETYKKYHNISPELYKKKTGSCIICSFNSVIELHHLDGNRANNSETNLIGLCPNHHKMLHHTDFKKEVIFQLKEKGFSVPKNEFDEFFK